jgi:hypothetical protein
MLGGEIERLPPMECRPAHQGTRCVLAGRGWCYRRFA